MAAPFPSRVGSRRWIASLAAMTAIVAMSIDTSLPAQPELARVYDVAPDTAALTLSLFIAGFAGAQLVTGYLSDALGRRRVLVVGLGLFSAAGAACALAPSMGALIAFRVLAGVAAAAPPVVARAMVRDTQPAAAAARLLSAMLAVMAVAPMVAPLIGGAVLELAGWRAVFGVLATLGAVLFVLAQLTLAETLEAHQRRTPSLRGLFAAYGTFLSTPGIRFPVLIGCASFAGQFAWIADSPFVFKTHYGVSSFAFALYFGGTALALIASSITGGRLLARGRSPRRMVLAGTVFLAAGGLGAAAMTQLTDLGIAGFMPPLVLYFIGIGLASPSAMAMAMEPVPEIAGTASSVVGFASMAAGSLSGYLTTKLGGDSPRGFTTVLAAMGVLALVLALGARHATRTGRGA